VGLASVASADASAVLSAALLAEARSIFF